MEKNRLNLVFPILAVALMLSLFGCGETFSGASTGVVVTKWGTDGTGDGEFGIPSGVAVASNGSVYVSDDGSGNIQKFTSEGVFVSKWGTIREGDGQFSQPYGVAVASDGSVYVVGKNNHRI